MFRTRTVVIVGAGASCEAGLPAGDELKKRIGKLLDIRYTDGYQQSSGDRLIAQELRRFAQLSNDANNNLLSKAWRLRDAMSLSLSIDNFIDAHNDKGIELCGKLGVARAILLAEGESKLAVNDEDRADTIDFASVESTWFVRFAQLLTEDVRRDRISQIFANVVFVVGDYPLEAGRP